MGDALMSRKHFLGLLLVLVALSRAAAQTRSNFDDAIREHRAKVEKMQREGQARSDAIKRKMGLSTRPSHRGLPPTSPADLTAGMSPEGRAFMAKARADAAAREAARIKPRFTFNGGSEFAYRFVLSLSTNNRTRYVAGYAAFQLHEKSAGSWQLLTRDNLQHTSSPDVLLPQAIGELTSMLRRTTHVSESGEEPDVDENLPAVLGNAEDWFFPPLPDDESDKPFRGETVIRQSDGEWSTVGFYNDKDRSARGYFDWSAAPQGASGGYFTVSDKRALRSDDGSIELIGEGRYVHDLARGILHSRSFRGTYKERGSVTQIQLEVSPADPSALDP
jgi:hypothetical protein